MGKTKHKKKRPIRGSVITPGMRKAQELDRAYFRAHPDVMEYERPYVPGETRRPYPVSTRVTVRKPVGPEGQTVDGVHYRYWRTPDGMGYHCTIATDYPPTRAQRTFARLCEQHLNELLRDLVAGPNAVMTLERRSIGI